MELQPPKALIGTLTINEGAKALIAGTVSGDIAAGTVNGDIVVGWLEGSLHVHTPATEHQKLRLRLINQVKRNWIDGILNQSLYRMERIPLKVEPRADAAGHHSQFVVRVPDWQPPAIPPHADILEIFDTYGGSLLITGGEGVGKTSLMLELCSALMKRALEDERCPVPVVFQLSTWTLKRRSLDEWMIAELKRQRIERDVAKKWLETAEIVPFLDGLDEVPRVYRAQCINSINAFHSGYGIGQLVVCSRTSDLKEESHLYLRGAVAIHPLTHSQVDDYLSRRSELSCLNKERKEDKFLHELLITPLMLWIASRAYRDGMEPLVRQENAERTQERLFASFVRTQLDRGASNLRFNPKHTLYWLAWLAAALEKNGSARIFFLEEMDRNWFRNTHPRFFPRFFVSAGYVIGCILVLGFACALMETFFGAINHGWHYALTFGWSDGFWGGALFGITFGVVSCFINFTPSEAFGLRFARQRARLRKAIRSTAIFAVASSALFFGITLLGLVVLSHFQTQVPTVLKQMPPDVSKPLGHLTAQVNLWDDVSGMIAISVVAGLVTGIAVGVVTLLTGEDVRRRNRPNYGTYSSIQRACGIIGISGVLCLIVGSVMGIFTGYLAWKLLPTLKDPIVFGLNGAQLVEKGGGLRGLLIIGLTDFSMTGLHVGLSIGLFLGMVSGGAFAIRHLVTRIYTWLAREAPLPYVPFLDYAVDKLFLLKQAGGGGYLFAHAMLAKYLAHLYESGQVSSAGT
jgi:eukaryotic-like serine/threonine-protein kinase